MFLIKVINERQPRFQDDELTRFMGGKSLCFFKIETVVMDEKNIAQI